MALHDNRGSQSGDHTSRDNAGRDIYQGADPNAVLDFFRRYLFEADQERNTAIKELRRELERLRDDVHIVSDALRTLRERVDDILDDRDRDRLERQRRQLALDLRLAALALLIVAVALALALLYHDTYALAAFGRYLIGAGLSLVAIWIRS